MYVYIYIYIGEMSVYLYDGEADLREVSYLHRMSAARLDVVEGHVGEVEQLQRDPDAQRQPRRG